MKTNEVNASIDKLNVDSETKKGILELIDLKTENDMEKILSEFRAINSEIKRLEDKQDAKFSIIIWAIGILIALIVGMKLF